MGSHGGLNAGQFLICPQIGFYGPVGFLNHGGILLLECIREDVEDIRPTP